MSTVGFNYEGGLLLPSDSIWGDCPNQALINQGGYFGDLLPLGQPLGTLVTASIRPSFGPCSIDCDDATVVAQKSGVDGGVITLTTAATDNNAFALFTAPLGPVTRNGGGRLWFESIVALNDVAADQGVFVGLVAQAGASRDVLSDNVAAGGVVAQSLIGFLQDLGDPNAFDIVYRSGSGTLVTLASDITNSAAITRAGGTVASLVAGTMVKLGIRYDGRNTLSFYVNGYKVLTQDVDSTIDQTTSMCGIAALKTGTGAAEQLQVQRLRAAFQPDAA